MLRAGAAPRGGRGRRARLLAFLAALALGGAGGGSPAAGQEIVFRHAVDDQPLELTLRPNEQPTAAVERFRATGRNPYDGDAAALAEGKTLYAQWCQLCHLPDGSGRMGPSLIDDERRYPRIDTDIGLFEVVYGGATGAMQAFGRRMTQDQILKVIAYVRSLKK